MNTHFLPLLTLASLFACAGGTRAQQLVADLRQTAYTPSSVTALAGYVATPSFVCFAAATDDTGQEPWRTDGTSAGTFRLADLVPGLVTSAPQIFCEHQGEVLFRATLPGVGAQLFATDGTRAGTRSLGTLGLSDPSFTITRLANGRLLAHANGQAHATDLTVAGTQPIPGLNRFVARATLGNDTFGTCVNGAGLYEIWATDGTLGGTRLVHTTTVNSTPLLFTPWNGRIYCIELYNNVWWIASTNGVTGLVRHTPAPGLPSLAVLERMFPRGNRLLYITNGAMQASDLTAAGTGMVALPCNDVGGMFEFGGQLYVRGTTAAHGYELWRTDGTPAGTSLVADLVPGPDGSHPEHFTVTANGVFYRARFGTQRHLMHLTGNGVLQDLGPIPFDAPIGVPGVANTAFVPFAGGVVFGASDALGIEPWFGSPTLAPARIADLNRSGPGMFSTAPVTSTVVHDQLFFVASDGVTGSELWSSRGTAASTQVLDLQPGPSGGVSVYATNILQRFGRRAVLRAGMRVGLTDGTSFATLATSTFSYDGLVEVFGEQIYFTHGGALHRSDGTVAGTIPLPGAGNTELRDIHVLPQRLVVQSASDTVYGTDGFAPRQLLILGDYQTRILGAIDDRCIVATGTALFATDGTPAGTVQLASLAAPVPTGSSSASTTRIYARAGDAIWETDGTPAGTRIACTLPPATSVASLIATNRELFAVAVSPAHGRELWRLDRAANQLVLAVDFAPGMLSGVLSAAALGVGDLLFVAGGDQATGIEPFVSDGTPAGTRLLADVHPGDGSSNPRLFGIAGDLVYFQATDGVHGSELWTMPLALAGAANVQPLGFGCPGSAGFPRLSVREVPRPGSAGFGVDVRSIPAFAPVVMGFATDDGAALLGSCELLLTGTVATRLGTGSLQGTASFPLPLPAGSGFLGLRLVAQGFALDPFAPNGFAGSDGLAFAIGY